MRGSHCDGIVCVRLLMKCDGTCAETRFLLSAQRTSPFKSVGESVQSTTGRRAVHISLQGLYCSCNSVFCSPVTLTGYPLYSLVSPSLLLPCLTVCHHISTGRYDKLLFLIATFDHILCFVAPCKAGISTELLAPTSVSASQ
jgi:hypothetical protein